MLNRIRYLTHKVTLAGWGVPLALAALVVLSYGLLLNQVGYYWDDWIYIFIYNQAGSKGLSDFYAYCQSRPIFFWLFSITTPLIGDNPLRWQVLNLCLRWIQSVMFWWFLRQLWPQHSRQASWMAFVFAVYPSFTQQFIAVTYYPAFIAFIAHIFSFMAVLKSVRKKSWGWGILSVFGLLFSIFSTEYFVGLELARPLMIWLALEGDVLSFTKRLRQTFLYWFPGLAGLGIYSVWRFFVVSVTTYEPGLVGRFLAQPFDTILTLAKTVVRDLITVGVTAFVQTVSTSDFFALTGHTLVVVVAGLLIFSFAIWRPVAEAEQPSGMVKRAVVPIIFGLILMVCGGVPAWLVPLSINLGFPYNRLTLPMMLGGSIVLVGMLELVSVSVRRKAVLLAVLVGLSAGFHYQVAESFRAEWNLQKQFFWQLAWRAPSMAPGTAILVDELPFQYTDDEALTTLVNQVYNPVGRQADLMYSILTLSKRQGSVLPSLPSNSASHSIYFDMVLFSFTGSTNQALLVDYPPGDCLRILHPVADDQGQRYPGLLSQAISWSHPETILLDAGYPEQVLRGYYGDASEDTWCFYYEKAALAMQYEQWDHIVDLGDQVFELDAYYPAPEELFPFIEGYASVGRIDDAEQLSQEVLAATRSLHPPLCDLWQRVLARAGEDEGRQGEIWTALSSLGCEVSE